MDIEFDWRKPVAAATAAVLANLLVVVYSIEILSTSTQFMPLTYGPVALFTAIGALGGYVVFEILKTYSEKPYENFLYVAATVMIFSFVTVIYEAPTEAGAGMEEIAMLSLTHVVAAVFTVGVILKMEIENY